MSAPEPGISRDVVNGVARALGELGFRLPAAAAGQSAFVDGSVADSILDAAATQLGDEALGVHLAERLPIGALGPLDYALCTSASLRQALGRVSRFYGVVSQRVQLKVVEDGPAAMLQFIRQSGINHSRHWLELSFAVVTSRARQTLGQPVKLLEVSFAHPAPRDPSAHHAFFGTQVKFGAPLDVLAFPAGLMPLPLQTAAESLAQVLEVKLKELEPTGAGDPLLERVRHAVVELLDAGTVGLEPTAQRLHRSARTLQRELQQRGTSHQTVLDEIRRERALTLLEEPQTNVTEVAYRLGFSEPSAFFRAFRRWTGTTPAAVKKTVGKRTHA